MEPQIPFPDMPSTRQLTQTVPDHEVLLVFNGDDDAQKFRDWLQEPGWQAFVGRADGQP